MSTNDCDCVSENAGIVLINQIQRHVCSFVVIIIMMMIVLFESMRVSLTLRWELFPLAFLARTRPCREPRPPGKASRPPGKASKPAPDWVDSNFTAREEAVTDCLYVCPACNHPCCRDNSLIAHMHKAHQRDVTDGEALPLGILPGLGLGLDITDGVCLGWGLG